ncbi:immunoglobulin superfamily DCC subclass member 4-like [Arapaima gigas]
MKHSNPLTVSETKGVGPLNMVLEPGQPLLLACHLDATDGSTNITWMRSGTALVDGDSVSLLPNGSLLLQPDMTEDMEGEYSCVSASPFGALVSHTFSLHLARPPRFIGHLQAQAVTVGARNLCWLQLNCMR